MRRRAAGSAVPDRDVEHPVGAELELAAVVVGGTRVGARDVENRTLAGGVGDVRVGADVELVDVVVVDRATGVGSVTRVEDVEEPVRGVVRVERHREQTPLSLLADPAVDVEELRGDAVVEHLDRATALDHEQSRVARGRGGVDRRGEVADRLQRHRGRGACRRRSGGKQAHSDPRDADPGLHMPSLKPPGAAPL